MAAPALQQEPPDFSLVLGGPLYQLFRRTRLTGAALELLRRRIVFFSLLCWVPLAGLSALEGHLLGGPKFSFLHDIETHVRFLVSLPVLLLAEITVHRRLRPAVRSFVDRHIVSPEELPKFTRRLIPRSGCATQSLLSLRCLFWCSPVAFGSGGMRLRSVLQAGTPRPKAERCT